MTTAHRPTWKAAVGQAQEGGWSAGGAISTTRSALDANAHTKLKFRATQVDKKKALKESLLKLEQAESNYTKQKNRSLKLPERPINPAIEEESKLKLLKQTADVDENKVLSKYDDADIDDDSNNDDDEWDAVGGGADNDDDDESDLDASSSEEDDDDSDDDEEEALQLELAKIRAEREAAKKKAEEEEAAEEESKLAESALIGNPLLSSSADGVGESTGKLKRKWNDDVVFRNQAKDEPKLTSKRFINDTVRNDFHKRFLNKFIK